MAHKLSEVYGKNTDAQLVNPLRWFVQCGSSLGEFSTSFTTSLLASFYLHWYIDDNSSCPIKRPTTNADPETCTHLTFEPVHRGAVSFCCFKRTQATCASKRTGNAAAGTVPMSYVLSFRSKAKINRLTLCQLWKVVHICSHRQTS